MAKHTADVNSPTPRHSQATMDDLRQKHLDTTTKNKLTAAIAKWVATACRSIIMRKKEWDKEKSRDIYNRYKCAINCD